MAIDITDDIAMLSNTVLGHVQVDDYGRFIMPADEEISLGDISDAVTYYQNNKLPKYIRNQQYYNGIHEILDKRKHPQKPYWKPDNRIVVNFPRKVVNDSNGFFIGHSPSISSDDKETNATITQWRNAANFDDVANEVSKQSILYGHSYFYLYQDQNSQCNVTASSPLNTFLIYDDTVAMNTKYAIQFNIDYENNLNIVVTDQQAQRTFIDLPNANEYLTLQSTVANPYPIIPVIEAKENDESKSILADLFSIFDELDNVMSEKSNDVDYFADAYMKLVNVNADEKSAQLIRDNRMIIANGGGNGRGNPDIGFLGKPSADETQENLINRLVNFIYEIANVVNVNDSAFSGNPSGVSLQMKFQPMKNIAATKSLKFETAFRQVFECMLSTQTGTPQNAWQNIQFHFIQNIPLNITEWVQMYGKISNYTWWSQLDFIDPDVEQERMAEQNKANIQLAQSQMNPLNTDDNNNQPNKNGNDGDDD